MKLLVTRRMTQAAEHALSARFETEILDRKDGLGVDEAAKALADYDAIMPTLGDRFTAEAFQGQPRCRLLANFGAGYNHIDVAAAAAAGIAVTNTPDAVTEATADIALTLILMTARRAGEGERLLRRGEWTGWEPTQLLGRHVTGCTVGIIGMGRIGKAIARRCHFGFGMEVLFHNRSVVSSLDFPARQVADLDELLVQSDFAIIAVPGGAETRHMIGAHELERLGPRSYLINIARGDVVEEAALAEALAQGRIAGAGLDVYEFEPRVSPALCAMENVTLLPHLGTAAEEVRTAMAMRAMNNLVAFAEGQALPDRVN
ncbi:MULTISPECIES: 2-hydroxyacid dehydrogenase [Paracoccus]|jgi:lactate dehydrogenase-like 2-hydroxyacid dehydrogenase|uniref:D-isomer specific 2-hydroxyacid dehydrogenase, NAD-binding protein n=1 Tax=Paracoccus denitrificans (strain Pd 1222) TaxID=318586 RepID=A1B444_PARDP|nr:MULTISPECIES: D-glycerate dehydrogenase [Paracoccus]ABL70288.1 D-isomer specific 2-hydroxyacid dehydrogenase, NAD-binding protein [Paracoccus denitrificans PD1222]MBB4627196.1 lactate dehydrogenase-like 2-hydroxyacid dehydrogenase [Paracoccus denitrificans]MCU7428031.1 D-glycerate dehydrogenase [Paracoccus denitrificans]QAR25638.1 D-glycerate dehydrogenase [Paracoccus denitrificans]UPV94536.1 D-glycerate dehydrogenase [Paracoccus denitrificans]